MKRALPGAVAVLCVGLGLPLLGQVAAVDLQEWPVPWKDSRPRDPYVAPDGRVWFVGQRGHYVASFDPDAAAFKKFDLDAGTGPHNLVVDAQGIVWYAGNLTGHIGRLDPATGAVEKIPMPDPAARDPHTLVLDRAGRIWFTVQGGNFVGRLDTRTRVVRLVAVPTQNARPYGIVLDADERPWVVLFGTNKLATIDPAKMTIAEIPLPRPEARPRRLGITRDGAVWYVDYAKGFLGRYDPASKALEEWPCPSGAGSRPYAMAIDGQDRIWVVESGVAPNKFVGFNPKTKQFFGSTDVQSGGGSVRHMFFHAPSQTIWFGTDTNTLGRAKLPRASS